MWTEYTKQSKHISTKYHFELNFREVVEVPLELKPEAELQRKLENFDTESEWEWESKSWKRSQQNQMNHYLTFAN